MGESLGARVIALTPDQMVLPLGPPFEDEQLAFDLPGLEQQDTASQSDCIFCHHANDQLNTVVGRRGQVFARLDNFPASRGHVELVPFRHVQSFFDMSGHESRDMFRLAKVIRHRLQEAYNPDGFTIGVNDGASAGRTIPHLHMHIIPRWNGDVPDPRGGIRQIFPDCNVEAWL